jgi:hypothetical protein
MVVVESVHQIVMHQIFVITEYAVHQLMGVGVAGVVVVTVYKQEVVQIHRLLVEDLVVMVLPVKVVVWLMEDGVITPLLVVRLADKHRLEVVIVQHLLVEELIVVDLVQILVQTLMMVIRLR